MKATEETICTQATTLTVKAATMEVTAEATAVMGAAQAVMAAVMEEDMETVTAITTAEEIIMADMGETMVDTAETTVVAMEATATPTAAMVVDTEATAAALATAVFLAIASMSSHLVWIVLQHPHSHPRPPRWPHLVHLPRASPKTQAPSTDPLTDRVNQVNGTNDLRNPRPSVLCLGPFNSLHRSLMRMSTIYQLEMLLATTKALMAMIEIKLDV